MHPPPRFSRATMDGVLNIDKPAGITSFGVVAAVRRLAGQRRVGHGGTLDPAATGVLPLFLGKATRIIEYLAGLPKEYRAEVVFGLVTDTYDTTGRVLEQRDASALTRRAVEDALGQFRGTIHQTPPLFSAIKQDGVPLYRLARAGVTVPVRARRVEIYRLELEDWRPPVAVLRVTCGRGTYLRSLAHDLGQALGCGASLQHLVRTRYGPLELAGAVPLARLEADGPGPHLQPMDALLGHLPPAVLPDALAEPVSFGRSVPLEGSTVPPDCTLARAYTQDGRFLAVLRRREIDLWHPEKVFVTAGGAGPA